VRACVCSELLQCEAGCSPPPPPPLCALFFPSLICVILSWSLLRVFFPLPLPPSLVLRFWVPPVHITLPLPHLTLLRCAPRILTLHDVALLCCCFLLSLPSLLTLFFVSPPPQKRMSLSAERRQTEALRTVCENVGVGCVLLLLLRILSLLVCSHM
jgi:hypothetical protein